MRPDIAEINSRYEILQDYVHPMSDVFDKFLAMDIEQQQEYKRLKNLYTPEYDILVTHLMEIIKNAEPVEVAEAYTEGCRLLQTNLSGFMGNNFCDDYYRVMVNAIYAQHFHTSWLFLQAIADNLGDKVSPLIEFALEHDYLHEKALSLIHQLKLQQFKPQVENLLNSSDSGIRLIAQYALDVLE